MLRILRCDKDTDTVTLSGQIKLKPSTCLLPAKKGEFRCSITVLEGKIRLNHSAYNPDGGTWSLLRYPTYDLNEGETKEIVLQIGESFKNIDHVEVVNKRMTKPAVFRYSILI